MHVVVVGCGRVGSQLAVALSEEGHDVVIIDKKSEAFRRLGTTFNGLTVEGLGFDQDVLREAGIDKAHAFAAVTDLDNTNMMAVEVATKIFAVPRAVARLYNPTREQTYQRLGLDYICGTTMLAEKMFQHIIAPEAEILTTVGNLHIVKVIAGPRVAGQTVADITRERDFRVVTIIRSLKNVLCEVDTEVEVGDTLVVITKKNLLSQVEALAMTGGAES